MSDINNLGGDQYGDSFIDNYLLKQAKKQQRNQKFLKLIYEHVGSREGRQDLIKLYFGGEDDNNNFGDC